MSALGHKRTFAAHQPMSALPPIATAKADFRTRSCLLTPKADVCSALAHVCFGPKADLRLFVNARLSQGFTQPRRSPPQAKYWAM
jgi:hypothetical protein